MHTLQNNEYKFFAFRFTLFHLLVIVAGCRCSLDATIEGVVTLDGVPLTTGTVTFHPQGGGAPAYGVISSNGEYSISTGANKGLVAGKYVVTVVATTPPTSSLEFGNLLVPERYGSLQQTPLRVTVIPGKNRINLDLTSKND